MKISKAVLSLALLFVMLTTPPTFAQYTSILDSNDADAKRTILSVMATSNLSSTPNAEAWMVLSSVALGMGIEKCHFPKSEDMTFMWKPALVSMTPDDIFTLNRLVTSNFRNAERDGRLSLERLFPVTRQAVLLLSDGKGRWNCQRISEVWTAARNYMSAKASEAARDAALDVEKDKPDSKPRLPQKNVPSGNDYFAGKGCGVGVWYQPTQDGHCPNINDGAAFGEEDFSRQTTPDAIAKWKAQLCGDKFAPTILKRRNGCG